MSVKVKKIMTRAVATMDLNSDVQQLVKKMLQCDVGNIIITDNNIPVGIVTEHDILKKIVSENLKLNDFSIKELMSAPLITIPPSEGIKDTAQKMIERRIRRLPVMENGRLVGIVTDTDIMAHSPKTVRGFATVKMSNKVCGDIFLGLPQSVISSSASEPLPGTSPSPSKPLPGTKHDPKKS